MDKTRLLCVWLGPLPDYFPLFAGSCANVPEIDFLLLTDSGMPDYPVPGNLKFLPLSREELLQRGREVLGVELALKRSYKLCDLKPMMGHLLAEHLEGYPYWGYFDLDQILCRSLTDCLARFRQSGADLFSTHTQYTHGPMTVFRNSRETRELFSKSHDWKRVATSPENFCFDECSDKYSFIATQLGAASCFEPTEGDFTDIPWEALLGASPLDCFTTVTARECQRGTLKAYGESTTLELLRPGESLIYNGDRIERNDGSVFSIYHWVTEKQRRKFHYPSWKALPERCLVTQYGFFDLATPRMNLLIALRRLLGASGVLVRDRIKHLLRRWLHLIGEGPDPGDFR